MRRYHELTKADMDNAYIKGAQSRQTEIDELIDTIKTSADSETYLFDELQTVKSERDELQKRIETLRKHLNESLKIIADDLNNLKGRKND